MRGTNRGVDAGESAGEEAEGVRFGSGGVAAWMEKRGLEARREEGTESSRACGWASDAKG